MLKLRRHFIFLFVGFFLFVSRQDACSEPSENFPKPPYPYFALSKREQGKITLAITFDPAGRVSKCSILNSSLSQKFGDETAHFITENWRSTKNAGKTLSAPIVYSLDGSSCYFPYPFYPMFALENHQGGTIKLAITFDARGRVAQVKIVNSTASSGLNVFTCAFVKEHWSGPIVANQTMTVPIIFNPSSSP